MEPNQIRAKRIADGTEIRVIFGGRASYSYLMEAVLDDEDKPEGRKTYRTGALIPVKAPAEVFGILRQAVADAVAVGVKKKWNGRKPTNLQLPLQQGNEKFDSDPEKYAAYKDMIYLTAKRVEKRGRPTLKAKGQPVTTSGVIESGDWCVFDVSFYPFDNKSKGVAVALNGVTLIEEGERFGQGPSESSIYSAADELYGDLLGALGSDDPYGDSNDDPLADMGGESDDDDPLAGL